MSNEISVKQNEYTKQINKKTIMKQKILLMALCLMTILFAKAQVTVENATTVKLGTGSNSVYSGNAGKYGQVTGVVFGTDTGTLIEAGNGESGGMYMDGDKVVIWSPGDDNLVNFCDEDNMQGQGNDFHYAIIAYIDGEGYYYQISDSTKKEQITTISSALTKMLKLRGVEYYHKMNTENASNSSDVKNKIGNEKKSGFLAQEVETVVPEAVATNEAGIKYVNYQALIPFLVEAIKEQQNQIKQLQKENSSMKKDIEQIKRSLSL